MLEKSPEQVLLLENLGLMIFGRSRLNCIEKGLCLRCGKPAVNISDLGEREYAISGICEACQEVVFAPPEDEE